MTPFTAACIAVSILCCFFGLLLVATKGVM